MFFLRKKDVVQNFHKRQGRVQKIRKMYESRELLKSALGKMPNSFVFYPIKNPLISTSS